MERKFKAGDKVKLVSGGPIMTVEDYESGSSNERKVKCVWFDEKKNLRRETFGEALVRKIEEPKPGGLHFSVR